MVADRELGGAGLGRDRGGIRAGHARRWRAGPALEAGAAAAAGFAVVVLGAPQLALLALPAPLPVVAAAAVLGGAEVSFWAAQWTSTMQRLVPAGSLARVAAWDSLGALVLVPVGFAAVGPVAERVGVGTVLGAGRPGSRSPARPWPRCPAYGRCGQPATSRRAGPTPGRRRTTRARRGRWPARRPRRGGTRPAGPPTPLSTPRAGASHSMLAMRPASSRAVAAGATSSARTSSVPTPRRATARARASATSRSTSSAPGAGRRRARRAGRRPRARGRGRPSATRRQRERQRRGAEQQVDLARGQDGAEQQAVEVVRRPPRREHDHADGEGAGQDDADRDVLPHLPTARRPARPARRPPPRRQGAAGDGHAGGDGDGRAGEEAVRQRLAGVGEAAGEHEHAQQAAGRAHQHGLREGALHELVVEGVEQPVHDGGRPQRPRIVGSGEPCEWPWPQCEPSSTTVGAPVASRITSRPP